MNEQLVRCAYWIGRARAMAALNDMAEMAEMLDKAADSLCEGAAVPSTPSVSRQLPATGTWTADAKEEEWQ